MPIVNRKSPPTPPRGYTQDLVPITSDLTINANHADCILQVNSGSGVTITLPNNLRPGFFLFVEQSGAGQVTFTAASGATLVNRQSHTKTAGQYAVASVYVRSNSNNLSAEWLLMGDTAS